MNTTRGALKGLIVTIAILVSVPALAGQESLAQKLFVEGGGGPANLSRALIEFGDPSVVEVPSAHGKITFAGFGIRPRKWMRFSFEWERENVAGNGSFAQTSDDPQESGGAVGKFGIKTSSKMIVGEFDLWARHRFHPFLGGGGGKTKVRSLFLGNSDPITFLNPSSGTLVTVIEPINQRNKDGIWDATGRVGVRCRITQSLEISVGVYGKDSVNAKATLVFFPGKLFTKNEGR